MLLLPRGERTSATLRAPTKSASQVRSMWRSVPLVAYLLLTGGALHSLAGRAQVPDSARVTLERTNVRVRGEYGAPILRTLDRGAHVDVLGPPSEETGFVEVREASGATGWIYEGLLRPTVLLQALGCGTQCGTERWAVKTGVDDDSSSIEPNPTDATVDELRGLQAPIRKPANSRVAPTEDRRYRVEAWLIGWKQEGNDSDYHIVIADTAKKTHTMIIESVDPACQMACSSTFKARFKAVRQQLNSTLGAPATGYRKLPHPKHVVITGIGFFDFLHGQTGVAPNGIELHPILDIQFPD